MLYIMVDENGFHSSLAGAKIRSIEAEARKKHILLQACTQNFESV